MQALKKDKKTGGASTNCQRRVRSPAFQCWAVYSPDNLCSHLKKTGCIQKIGRELERWPVALDRGAVACVDQASQKTSEKPRGFSPSGGIGAQRAPAGAAWNFSVDEICSL